MSTLWIEWPKVAMGLWYGQAYVMDNKHRWIYWWHFECTEIPWRDSEAHCIMIMHGPMLQGSVHIYIYIYAFSRRFYPKRLTVHPGYTCFVCTQFLEAENIPVLAWPAYSPDMSPIEHVWDALDRRIRQCVPVPANIQQLCNSHWVHAYRPQSTTWSTLCEGDVLHCMRQMVVTPDTDWFSDWFSVVTY